MIKLVFCPEQFRDYWEQRHGPLVQQHAEALGIQRYVQSYTVTDERFASVVDARGAPTGYDGVAELWFTSLADMATCGATPQGKAAGKALIEDEAGFIDLSRSPLWISEEKEFVG